MPVYREKITPLHSGAVGAGVGLCAFLLWVAAFGLSLGAVVVAFVVQLPAMLLWFHWYDGLPNRGEVSEA